MFSKFILTIFTNATSQSVKRIIDSEFKYINMLELLIF